MSPNKLVSMAHLMKFWHPRMHAAIIKYTIDGGEKLKAFVRKAVRPLVWACRSWDNRRCVALWTQVSGLGYANQQRLSQLEP